MQRYVHKKGSNISTIILSVALFAVCIVVGIQTVKDGEQDISLAVTENNVVKTEKPEVLTTIDTEQMYTGSLVLVNDTYEYKFLDNTELVNCFEYPGKKEDRHFYVKNQIITSRADVLSYLNIMASDFNNQYSKDDIMIDTAYLDYNQQESIYKGSTGDKLNPGHTEHHTGYAFDFLEYTDNKDLVKLTGDGNYSWINDNAYKYGFVLRYSEDKEDITKVAEESWHYRFVGQPHATVMYENNFCLEEYLEYLKDFTYDKPLITKDNNQQQYIVYYVANTSDKTEAYKPVTELSYTNDNVNVSGNNYDGFIFTIKVTG